VLIITQIASCLPPPFPVLLLLLLLLLVLFLPLPPTRYSAMLDQDSTIDPLVAFNYIQGQMDLSTYADVFNANEVATNAIYYYSPFYPPTTTGSPATDTILCMGELKLNSPLVSRVEEGGSRRKEEGMSWVEEGEEEEEEEEEGGGDSFGFRY